MGMELKKAADLLNENAPPGERLAYVNPKEEEMLKHAGGAGVEWKDTGVPTYFIGNLISSIGSGLGSLGSAVGSGLSGIGNAVASGIGGLGSAVGRIPVVGNVLGDTLSGVGSAVGNLAQGDIGGALGSLYTGADTLVGGVLPGGQAFSQGYLGNLYGKADNLMRGYLPNVGGVGITPTDFKINQLFANPNLSLEEAGFMADAMKNPGAYSAEELGLMGMLPKSGGFLSGSGFDKAMKLANIGSLGYGLYNMINPQDPETANAQAANRLMGGGGGNIQRLSGGATDLSADSAMAGAPTAAGVGGAGTEQDTPLTEQLQSMQAEMAELQSELDRLRGGASDGKAGGAAAKAAKGKSDKT